MTEAVTSLPAKTPSGLGLFHPRTAYSLLFHSEKGRFLVAGGVNTAFGYAAFALLYHILSRRLHYTLIVIISIFFNITFSFLTHKFYAFRARGNWIREYLRYYVVYAVPSVFGLVAFALCIEVLKMNAYATQAFITAVGAIMSYLGHKNYSFRKQRKTSSSA